MFGPRVHRPRHLPLKLYYSYCDADAAFREELAEHLSPLERGGLIAGWHRQCVSAGGEWSQQVAQQLQTADIILLLLSASFIAAEDSQAEIAEAIRRHQEGSARIIPVVVHPVAWEELPLGKLRALPPGKPVSSWDNRNEAWLAVVKGIRQIAIELSEQPQSAIQPPAAGPALRSGAVATTLVSADPSQPAAFAPVVAGPGRIVPPGNSYDPAWYVPRPRQETDLLNHLASAGTPAIITAPRQFGKTTMIAWLLDQLTTGAAANQRVIAISLGAFLPQAWASSDSFWLALAQAIVEACGGDESWIGEAWRTSKALPERLRWILEKYVFSRLASSDTLILSIDQADRIVEKAHDSSLVDTFFSVLRAWVERSESSERHLPWHKLRLILAVSMTPSFLAQQAISSPFNMIEPIFLEEFDQEQISILAARYGLTLSQHDHAALDAQIKGHPYLVRQALYYAALREQPVAQVLADAQLFSAYVKQCRRQLIESELYDTAFSVYKNPNISPGEKAIYYLQGAGIIAARPAGGWMLRYPLYARIFDL